MASTMRGHSGAVQGRPAFGSRSNVSGHSVVRAPVAPCQQHGQPRSPVVVRSEGRDSGFVTGFVVGGVVMGTLGFLFAPQISKALLGDDQRLRLPRFMEDEAPKDPEQTKQDLIEKIAQLNASIDEVAATLKGKEDAAGGGNAVPGVKVESDGMRIA